MNRSSTFKMIKLPLLKVRSCIRVGGYPIFQTQIHSQLYERVYSNNRQKIYDDGHSLLRSLRSQSIGFWGREPHKYDPNELEFPPWSYAHKSREILSFPLIPCPKMKIPYSVKIRHGVRFVVRQVPKPRNRRLSSSPDQSHSLNKLIFVIVPPASFAPLENGFRDTSVLIRSQFLLIQFFSFRISSALFAINENNEFNLLV